MKNQTPAMEESAGYNILSNEDIERSKANYLPLKYNSTFKDKDFALDHYVFLDSLITDIAKKYAVYIIKEPVIDETFMYVDPPSAKGLRVQKIMLYTVRANIIILGSPNLPGKFRAQTHWKSTSMEDV